MRILFLCERIEKHLERAQRFVWSLTVPVEYSKVRHVVFGGDCELTPTRILLNILLMRDQPLPEKSMR